MIVSIDISLAWKHDVAIFYLNHLSLFIDAILYSSLFFHLPTLPHPLHTHPIVCWNGVHSDTYVCFILKINPFLHIIIQTSSKVFTYLQILSFLKNSLWNLKFSYILRLSPLHYEWLRKNKKRVPWNKILLRSIRDSNSATCNTTHTVILPDWTLKKWGLSNFAFQHC